MRKTIKLLGCLLLIMVITLAITSCGKDKNEAKKWPEVSYLSSSEEYTGSGSISHINNWDNGDVTIDIQDATSSSVSEYVDKLIAAGWKHEEGSPAQGDNKTNYCFIKDGSETSIEVISFNSTQTQKRSSGDYNYNLQIQIKKEGNVGSSPQTTTLSKPVVTVNASGLASWPAITNASSYKYKINGGSEQNTTNSSVQLTNGQSIVVKAIGTGYTDSEWSTSVTYNEAGASGSLLDSIPAKVKFTFKNNRDDGVISIRKVEKINNNYYIDETQSDNDDEYLGTHTYEVGGVYHERLYLVKNDNTYSLYYYNGEEWIQETSALAIPTNDVTAFNLVGCSNWYKTYYDMAMAATNVSTEGEYTVRKVDEYWRFLFKNGVLFKFQTRENTNDEWANFQEITDWSTDILNFSANNLPGAATQGTTLSIPNVSINNTGLASWSAITNATGYKYKINNGAEQATNNTSIQLALNDSITVKAVGNGTTYLDSAYSQARAYTNQQGTTLSVPNVSINNTGLASWSAITNATGYKYKINNGTEQATNNTSVQLTLNDNITVKAVGNGTTYLDSAYSQAQKYEIIECEECHQTGKHDITCSHSEACGFYQDKDANNLCDVCEKNKALHITTTHVHIDENKDGKCDIDNYYYLVLITSTTFTFEYDDVSGYNHVVIYDGEKLYYSFTNGNDERLFVYDESSNFYDYYTKVDGDWELSGDDFVGNIYEALDFVCVPTIMLYKEELMKGTTLTSGGTETIVNRACTKYSYVDNTGEIPRTHCLWVDNATGMVVKMIEDYNTASAECHLLFTSYSETGNLTNIGFTN